MEKHHISVIFSIFWLWFRIFASIQSLYAIRLHKMNFNIFTTKIFIENRKKNKMIRKLRGHPGLNRGPLDLQSNALPLSYIPMFKYTIFAYFIHSFSHSIDKKISYHRINKAESLFNKLRISIWLYLFANILIIFNLSDSGAFLRSSAGNLPTVLTFLLLRIRASYTGAFHGSVNHKGNHVFFNYFW